MGGTIASQADEQGQRRPRLRSGDLHRWVEDIADVVPVDVRHVRGSAVTPADMCSLAHELARQGGNGCDGVVVTHGTDTIEETVYVLALMLDLGVPVVATGAMRPADQPGADGPANLRAAVRVASTPSAADLGPVLVLADEVHLARPVTKTNTAKVAAFESPGLGPVGQVVEGRVYMTGRRPRPDYLGLPEEPTARVELVWVAAGSDGLLVDAAASVASGIVIAATGGGHVPPPVADAIGRALQRGVAVVLASRCGSGGVLEETYHGIGSETHLRELGAIPAGDLAPLKARLRLMFALSLGISPAEAFATESPPRPVPASDERKEKSE